jgi:hypothetical protein
VLVAALERPAGARTDNAAVAATAGGDDDDNDDDWGDDDNHEDSDGDDGSGDGGLHLQTRSVASVWAPESPTQE